MSRFHSPFPIRPFALLGALLISTSAAASPCDTAPADAIALSVATLNTWGLPWPIAPRRRARMRATSDWLAGSPAQIVGLQEVWKGARRHLVGEGLQLGPLSRGDSGLGLVTTTPLHHSQLTAFDAAVGPDAWKSKGVLSASVDIADFGDLAVHVTHLQAGRSGRAARARRTQVQTLLDLLDGFPGPAVLLGDFNLHSDLPDDLAAAEALSAAGWIDGAAAVGQDGVTHRKSAHRLDRIWTRSGDERCLTPVAALIDPDRPSVPSDHLLVELTLQAWAP